MDFRVSGANAEVSHGAVVNNEQSVASGHSPSLGSVVRVSTEPRIPEAQRPENATVANESLFQRVISGARETVNKLRERMNSTAGMSSRALQIFSALSQAYYYRDSPKAAAKILSLAGIFGKCAQYMVTREDVLSALKSGSYSQEAEFFVELMTITSRYPAGELNIDNVLEILNERIASSGYMEEFQPDGAYIRHVNTVGRGTICQLDHVDINGADYVVKTVSPKFEECIVEDVDLLAEIIFPFMGLIGLFSKSDVELLSEVVKTFRQETDLSIELENTKRQADILKRLSETKAYSIEVSVGDQTCQVPLKVKAPVVNEALSSSNMLVMEFIDGCSLDRLSEVKERLRLWRPDWNDCKQLSEGQIESIIESVSQQVLNVFLEAWQQSGFLNTDFQSGNFMMQLEDGGITINFIDHGSCVELKDSMELINNSINFDLLHGLFVFFHNRCHGKNQAEESQPSSLPGGANQAYDSSAGGIDEGELPDINSLSISDENISKDRSSDNLIKQNDSASEATTVPTTPDALSAPSRIRDLTFIPLSYSQVERINRMISEHQKEFGKTIIPSMNDFLNQYQREQTVEQVCLQLFNWLQSGWVLRNEDDESPQTLQDAFVNELPTLLYGLAINNENLNLEDERKLRKTVDFKFDRFVRNMGFHLRPENILFLRVKAQIKTFRLAVLGEPQDN